MERSFVDAEVILRCPAGHPLVRRCHPVRNDRTPPEPFPTLFWLACDAVAAQVARLEYGGLIGEIERRIAADPELRARVHADHVAYAAERWSLLATDEVAALEACGRADALRARGIGGIADLDRVKCLHLHFAHHLARSSAIGALLPPIRLCPVPGGAPDPR